jgi:flagella basal body P-ring formation protein FlgA
VKPQTSIPRQSSGLMPSEVEASNLKLQNEFNLFKVGFGVGMLVFWLLCPSFALENPEEKLTQVIKDHIIAAHPEYDATEIRITYKYADKIFDSLKEYNGNVKLKVLDVHKDFRPVGNVIFPIKVYDDNKIDKKIFVRTKVGVFKKVIVAKNKIKRGQVIKEDDIAAEERDIAMLPEKYFFNLEKVANSEAKTTISQNNTIFTWMVRKVPLIHRGEKATIIVKGENLFLKASGRVLGDGYLGEKIKIKREESKTILEGVLVSADEIEVKI